MEAAVPLAKALHHDIVSLGHQLENVATESESGAGARMTPEQRQVRFRRIISDVKDLLARIDSNIPLLQLAITASGESMSSSLPAGVSPSRLLQASTFVTVGDTQFSTDPNRPVQIGPSFTLSMYMLFIGHGEVAPKSSGASSGNVENSKTPNSSSFSDDRPYGLGEGDRKPIWQEVLHKARVRLCRTPPGLMFDSQQGYRIAASTTSQTWNEQHSWDVKKHHFTDYFSYFLEIIEDLDDGRVHDDSPMSSFLDVECAGKRQAVPIHQISKIFYTDTGKILNIGSDSDPDSNPVLLIKRDITAEAPRPRDDISPIGMRGQMEVQNSSDEELKDDQDEINRQIRSESEIPESLGSVTPSQRTYDWDLPSHLDPEWFALEVFAQDDMLDDDSESTIDESDEESPRFLTGPSTPTRLRSMTSFKSRRSLDSSLIQQIRNFSLRSPQQAASSPLRPTSSRSETVDNSTLTVHKKQQRQTGEEILREPHGSFVERSPFGAITSSLSLLEMIIRLSSLQQFQQMSHLAIPDHILTFFLEETSTTGLKGPQRWKARTEAKRKVGFDPYMDTP